MLEQTFVYKSLTSWRVWNTHMDKYVRHKRSYSSKWNIRARANTFVTTRLQSSRRDMTANWVD